MVEDERDWLVVLRKDNILSRVTITKRKHQGEHIGTGDGLHMVYSSHCTAGVLVMSRKEKAEALRQIEGSESC